MDAHKQRIGFAKVGEMFVRLDEPVPVENRHYGTVGGYTGYVLTGKLKRF